MINAFTALLEARDPARVHSRFCAVFFRLR
jgi:hypothetical protein